MKPTACYGLLATLLFLPWCGCEARAKWPDYDPNDDWYVEVGGQAPEFSLMTTRAEKIRLSDLRGKVVVANFFATWCGPCLTEVRVMNEELYPLAKKDPRLAVITIDSLEQIERVTHFVRKEGYEWPFLVDTHGEVFKRYCKTGGIPRLMIIDHTGKIVHLSKIGFSKASFSEMMGTLESLLARIPTETAVVDDPTPDPAPLLRAADGDPSLAAVAPAGSEP